MAPTRGWSLLRHLECLYIIAMLIPWVYYEVWHAPLTCVVHNFGTDYPGFPYTGIAVMCVNCIIMGIMLTYVTVKSGSVWPDYRRQGIAGRLVSCAMSALDEEGINKVALVAFKKNEVGNAFWESVGFTGRDDLVYRNKNIRALDRIDTLFTGSVPCEKRCNEKSTCKF